MDEKTKNEWHERAARNDANHRALMDLQDLRASQRQEFRAKILPGTDMFAWIAPDSRVPSDEVLAEHGAQLRNLVRYTMQFALADDLSFQTNMSAANTATRMIRASIALTKEFKATNSKTVRGGSRKKRTQD
jgi:hypothetical protein